MTFCSVSTLDVFARRSPFENTVFEVIKDKSIIPGRSGMFYFSRIEWDEITYGTGKHWLSVFNVKTIKLGKSKNSGTHAEKERNMRVSQLMRMGSAP